MSQLRKEGALGTAAAARPVVDPAVRSAVFRANVALYERGLARFTFGNASAVDRESGLVVIKPSGVAYDALTADGLVVTDLEGQVVAGAFRPSSDLATHVVLYRAWPEIGGVVHTHSRYATAWAQAGRELPCLGTTHADAFPGAVPVTRWLTAPETDGEYEAETGRAIVERFGGAERVTGAVLVRGHASFCWAATVAEAVDVAAMLEEVARLAYYTVTLRPDVPALPDVLRDRHYDRKHGPRAYYGQPTVAEEGR
jgi:L-ribulose-5-phosphate 4-epimerase